MNSKKKYELCFSNQLIPNLGELRMIIMQTSIAGQQFRASLERIINRRPVVTVNIINNKKEEDSHETR